MTTNETTELAACPFCGGAATAGPTREMHMVECDNADCHANPMVVAMFQHLAVERWNRRAAQPQPGGDVVAWRIWRSDRWCFAYSANRDFYRSEKWEPLCVAPRRTEPTPETQRSHSAPGAQTRRLFDRPPIELHAAPAAALPIISPDGCAANGETPP